jgi:hypothetical protein
LSLAKALSERASRRPFARSLVSDRSCHANMAERGIIMAADSPGLRLTLIIVALAGPCTVLAQGQLPEPSAAFQSQFSAADDEANAPGEFPEGRLLSPHLGQYLPSTLQPSPDVLTLALNRASYRFVPRESLWNAAERKAFSAVLAQRPIHTLVVPAQVQGFGTDRITRSLWTAALSYALADAGVDVADPYLVMRALGDGQRRIPLESVDALAVQLHATRVIETFIGHNRHRQVTVLVRTYDRSGPSRSLALIRPQVVSGTALPFSDEDPPALTLQKTIPGLLRTLGATHREQANRNRVDRPAKPAALSIPEDPAVLVKPGAAGTAPLRFALLGALTPSDSIRARERLFEKALLALDRTLLAKDQDDFLRAYALFQLNLRPAALAVLTSASASPAIVGLRALLNGNLTGTDALIAGVSGIERILLAIELNDLRLRYVATSSAFEPTSSDPALMALASRGPLWNVLVKRRVSDLNPWEVENNFDLKAILDQLAPLRGQSLDEIVEQRQAIGNPGTAGISPNLLVVQHLRAVPAATAASWTVARSRLGPTLWDLVSVVEADAEANLLKTLQLIVDRQVAPDQALALLDQLATYYDGHPDFATWRSLANVALDESARADERAHFAQAAHEASWLAIYWAQGQSRSVIHLLEHSLDDQVCYTLASAYSYDFPARDYWLRESSAFFGSEKADRARKIDALNYTQASPVPASALSFSSDPQIRQLVATALVGRFLGNPGIDRMRLAQVTSSQSSTQVRQTLRGAIQANPDNWPNYEHLASIMIGEDGDYAGAEGLLESYPKFKEHSAGETVTLSNYAYDAARPMYWRGEIQPARRLYTIAAGFQDGSEAGLTAAQRLKTMDADFAEALKFAEVRASRYPNGYSHRDLITLLYATGDRDRASAAFEAVAAMPDGPIAWQAVLVGQRIGAFPDPELVPWIERHLEQSHDPRLYRYGATLTLLWNTTDRLPPKDLPDQVRKLQHDPIGIAEKGEKSNYSSYPDPDQPGLSFVIWPSSFRRGIRAPVPVGTRLDSDLTLFARAYTALRNQQFGDAVQRFDDLAARYPIETYIQNGSAPYALGYFAYASSKSGDPLALEPFLDAVPEVDRGFDHYLAKAFFAAGHRDPDKALSYLKGAYNRMPWTDDRPVFVDYQYAEACEWIFSELGDPRFHDLEVDFAERYQIANPFRAWTHAVVAEAAHDPATRTRELGLAMYLDPHSIRLKKFRPSERDAARKWAQHGTPFKTPIGRNVSYQGAG